MKEQVGVRQLTKIQVIKEHVGGRYLIQIQVNKEYVGVRAVIPNGGSGIYGTNLSTGK